MLVGVLGGLIGLGGAEFRLPILIGFFGFVALEAVILNKAVSLVVVASALAFRTSSVPIAAIAEHLDIVLNLLAGSAVGAWAGADLATRIERTTLHRIIAVLLLAMAGLLVFGHQQQVDQAPLLVGRSLFLAGLAAGMTIGVVAALLGVAGGELLIPTLILLFGVDIKTAGSLSLAISLPTLLIGFARYSRDPSFAVLSKNGAFAFWMAVGSVVGAYIGSVLLPFAPVDILVPLLALVLCASAVKIWVDSER